MTIQAQTTAKHAFYIDPVLIAGDPQQTSVQVDFVPPSDRRGDCDVVYEARDAGAGGFAVRAFRLTPEKVARLWAARYAHQTVEPPLNLSETEGLPLTFRALGLTGREMAGLVAAISD